MSAEELAAAVAVVSICAYAVFGGADFGGGVWTLLADGSRRDAQRNALERAIGPVWETNHVWLIVVVVTLFVVFPGAFSAIFTALYIPLFIVLVGIVFRGAAFAFHHYGDPESRFALSSQQVFGIASTVTPFTFGLVIGAVSSGEIELQGTAVTSGPFAGWLTPFALACGLIGLLTCAFVAAAFMIPRTTGALQRDFRLRAVLSSLALGGVTALAIPIAHVDEADLAGRLDQAEVVAVMAATALSGVAGLAVLWRGPAPLAPFFAGATTTGTIVAWALAMNPYLVLPSLRIGDVAAPDITVKSFLIALPFGALVLVPSLLLLYTTLSREEVGAGEEESAHTR